LHYFVVMRVQRHGGLLAARLRTRTAVNNNMLYIGGQFSSIASSGVSANNAVAWG
jgi:hypothetical protein